MTSIPNGEVGPVRNGQRASRQTRQAGRAINVRALLRDREFIKVTAFVLPTPTKRQILEMMERLRQVRRTDRSGQPASNRHEPLPEMTDGEMVREINWRIGTLPPEDAEALAQYVRRFTRWRAERRVKTPPSRAFPTGARSVLPPD